MREDAAVGFARNPLVGLRASDMRTVPVGTRVRTTMPETTGPTLCRAIEQQFEEWVEFFDATLVEQCALAGVPVNHPLILEQRERAIRAAMRALMQSAEPYVYHLAGLSGMKH